MDKLRLMLAVVLVANAPVEGASPFVRCAVQGDRVEVDLGSTRRTAFVGVVTPSQKLLHLVNPTLKVDLLGDRYASPSFALSIPGEQGVTRDGKTLRIFAERGEYSVVFRDANTTAGEELRTFSCEVRVE